jgi:hypothetical protein
MIFGTPDVFAQDAFADPGLEDFTKYWTVICKGPNFWEIIPKDDADLKEC